MQTYKRLTDVERAFRCIKTVDLHVRPVHHRADRRVRAHVPLCMLAYYVDFAMRKSLQSLTYTDEQPEQAEQLRESAVAKAKVSPSAAVKVEAHQNSQGMPVADFKQLLRHLASVARVKLEVAGVEYVDYPQLTATQREAFRWLDVDVTLKTGRR